MTKKEVLERKRLAYKRRLLEVRERFDLPQLDSVTLYYLSLRCANIEGKEGLNERDLRSIHRLANRGMFRSIPEIEVKDE